MFPPMDGKTTPPGAGPGAGSFPGTGTGTGTASGTVTDSRSSIMRSSRSIEWLANTSWSPSRSRRGRCPATFEIKTCRKYDRSAAWPGWGPDGLCPAGRGRPAPPATQFDRASSSILFNIGEGAGKTAKADKQRSYEIARGSTTEAATQLDVLRIRGLITAEQYQQARALLVRVAQMLSRLCGGPRSR